MAGGPARKGEAGAAGGACPVGGGMAGRHAARYPPSPALPHQGHRCMPTWAGGGSARAARERPAKRAQQDLCLPLCQNETTPPRAGGWRSPLQGCKPQSAAATSTRASCPIRPKHALHSTGPQPATSGRVPDCAQVCSQPGLGEEHTTPGHTMTHHLVGRQAGKMHRSAHLSWRALVQ